MVPGRGLCPITRPRTSTWRRGGLHGCRLNCRANVLRPPQLEIYRGSREEVDMYIGIGTVLLIILIVLLVLYVL